MERRLPVLLLLLAAASCQTDMRQYEPGWDELHITRSRSEVELEGRYRDEKREGAAVSTELSEVEFRETYRILFAGFYYHPKLVEFDANLGLGLDQRFVRYENGDDRDISGTNTEYRFGVDILKDQPYGVEVFASRTEVWARQNFFETRQARSEAEGFSIVAREWWIPSKLTYRQFRYRGLRGFEYSEESTSWQLDGQRSGDFGSLSYTAEIIDYDQFATTGAVQDRRARATYMRTGGAQRRNRFRSHLSADERDGVAGFTRLTSDNSYRHFWLPNFSGTARLSLNRTDRGALRTDAYNLSGGLQHRLFASLSSNVSLGWGHSEFNTGSSDSFTQGAGVNYNKQVPFGAVRAGQSVFVNIQDRDSVSGVVAVVGESKVFTLGTPIFLDNPNVELDSVVVRDSTGLVVYTENVDYFLVQVGALTRIDIPVSSLISPGDTILVDYEFVPSPARRSQTVSNTSTVGIQVPEAFDLGVTYQTTDSKVLSGVDDGSLDDTRRLNALLQTYPAENLVVGAEYEDVVSLQVPFIRYRAFTNWTRSLGTSSSFSTSADVYWLELADVGDERGTTARATVTGRLGVSATGTLSAQYRNLSLIEDDSEGYLLEASYRRRFGETRFRAALQYVREEFRLGVDQDLLRLEVVVTREF